MGDEHDELDRKQFKSHMRAMYEFVGLGFDSVQIDWDDMGPAWKATLPDGTVIGDDAATN